MYKVTVEIVDRNPTKYGIYVENFEPSNNPIKVWFRKVLYLGDRLEGIKPDEDGYPNRINLRFDNPDQAEKYVKETIPDDESYKKYCKGINERIKAMLDKYHYRKTIIEQ